MALFEVSNASAAVQMAKDAGLITRATSGRADRSLVGRESIDAAARCLWVFGNEAQGVNDEVMLACDEAVAIPMFGEAESLNVSVAATLAMYESALAQRGYRPVVRVT
jgi:TrmH family RNA methyltransferase